MHDYMENFYELGEILFKLFDGERLSEMELLIIAHSTDEDKLMAIKLYTPKRLRNKNDRSLLNYEDNLKFLTMFERVQNETKSRTSK